MLTLAVDTAADRGSIALSDGDRLLEEKALHAPASFGQTLFGEIEALLARNGVKLSDIRLYAAASGPGSFTGVRIGLAAIKGLAEVAEKPAIGVSNLQAMAEYGSTALRAPVIDAKRGEVYGAVFDGVGNEVVPAVVMPFAGFREAVGGRAVEWITAGFELPVDATRAPYELAAAIAQIALRRHLAGDEGDPAVIEANYVRRSDAEIFWKDHQ